jgi:hypothetical protein
MCQISVTDARNYKHLRVVILRYTVSGSNGKASNCFLKSPWLFKVIFIVYYQNTLNKIINSVRHGLGPLVKWGEPYICCQNHTISLHLDSSYFDARLFSSTVRILDARFTPATIPTDADMPLNPSSTQTYKHTYHEYIMT